MTPPSRTAKSNVVSSESKIFGFRYLFLAVGSWIALTGTVLALLWMGSRWAVPGVHAVMLGDGQYIHGDSLGCVRSGESHKCAIDLDGEKLAITTNGDFWGPSVVWVCDATFKGKPIECDPRTVTSSYQPHGVKITDAEVIAATQADKTALQGWKTSFLGHTEKSFLLFGVTAGIGIPITALVISATITYASNRTSRLSPQGIFALSSALIVPAAAITIVILEFAIICFDYVD